MTRAMYPILIVLCLCTATGCPPTAATPGGQCTAGCMTAAATQKAMPSSQQWTGQQLQEATRTPGRAFVYLAGPEATVYSVVIVDGNAVTARFEISPDALGAFITQPAARTPTPTPTPTGEGPKTSSPTVKVGGPPRPLMFVVPAPPRAAIDDPAYWVRLACLHAGAEAGALSGRTTAEPPPAGK
ncbi:MAG TPA: hypothetical protein VGD37_15520 [Kofleriaceae bacterium]|jgi:hypothetical protein